jgi:pilus assembly protein Flp/PilA
MAVARQLMVTLTLGRPLTKRIGDGMMSNFIAMTRDEEGATMVEYGLLVALIALVAITGVTLLGTNLNSLFNNVAGSI